MHFAVSGAQCSYVAVMKGTFCHCNAVATIRMILGMPHCNQVIPKLPKYGTSDVGVRPQGRRFGARRGAADVHWVHSSAAGLRPRALASTPGNPLTRVGIKGSQIRYPLAEDLSAPHHNNNYWSRRRGHVKLSFAADPSAARH